MKKLLAIGLILTSTSILPMSITKKKTTGKLTYQEELERNGAHYNTSGEKLSMESTGEWTRPLKIPVYAPEEETGAHYNSYGEQLYQTSSGRWERAPKEELDKETLIKLYLKGHNDGINQKFEEKKKTKKWTYGPYPGY